MSRYTAKDLSLMKMKDLWSHAELEGLDVHVGIGSKYVTKKSLVKRILAAYAAKDVDRIADGDLSEPPQAEKVTEPSREFEALCNGPSIPESDGDNSEPPKRGGFRPGAGRPRGMTEEKALYNRLSEQPHPAVKQMFELLFDAWATKAACPGVRLTEQEARDIALPWTNVLELMGVADRIPNWIVVALACGWNTLSIVKAKAALARELRTKIEQAAVASQAQPQPAGG